LGVGQKRGKSTIQRKKGFEAGRGGPKTMVSVKNSVTKLNTRERRGVQTKKDLEKDIRIKGKDK